MKSRPTVLLVHGLILSPLSMVPVGAYLQRLGWKTSYFTYSSLLEPTARVQRRLAETLSRSPTHVVARMIHRRMVRGGMVHSLHLALVHLRMIHTSMAVGFIASGRICRLRYRRTGPRGNRMAHRAVACGLPFAFGLGRFLLGGHRVSGMVLREGRGGGAHQEHGDDQAHQSSPTRFTSGALPRGATVTIWNMPECMW